MRAKRSKQYRKLMNQYGLTFNFREPYQILVDAEMVLDTHKLKMDLAPALSRTVHGKIKPMITQCSMRHLYADSTHNQSAITVAKEFERRRCNHHTLPEPLSTIDCWKDVIDPKGNGVNKHRYVVASQNSEIRAWLRRIPGVPLIYVYRSVMLLEPMAESTESARNAEEREKFRAGVVRPKSGSSNLGKRKREMPDEDAGNQGGPVMEPEASRQHDGEDGFEGKGEGEGTEVRKKPVRKGPKAPNPLSMRKKKEAKIREPRKPREGSDTGPSIGDGLALQIGDGDAARRKRRRKPSSDRQGEVVGVEPDD